jgi:hypothetical protein
LINRKPGFRGKIFWSLEIPFKTGFTVLIKNKKHSEHTLTRLGGAIECKNIVAETDYRFQKNTA